MSLCRFLAVLMLASMLFSGSHAGMAVAAEEETGPKSEFQYVELSPLTLPIITERGATQQLSIVISIEVPDGMLEEVQLYVPRLADAYLSTLYGSLGAGHYIMPNGLVDVQSVKDRLHTVTAHILKEEQFHSILLQMVQQRQLY